MKRYLANEQMSSQYLRSILNVLLIYAHSILRWPLTKNTLIMHSFIFFLSFLVRFSLDFFHFFFICSIFYWHNSRKYSHGQGLLTKHYCDSIVDGSDFPVMFSLWLWLKLCHVYDEEIRETRCLVWSNCKLSIGYTEWGLRQTDSKYNKFGNYLGQRSSTLIFLHYLFT